LTKAVAARELSERFWRLPGDEPFIAGLLQDLGMLALIQSLGAPYVQLVEGAAASGGDLLALEVQSLGFDHTQLSSRLLEGWGLPKTLVAATQSVQSAHEIDSIPAPARCMPQILHLAELLARVLADHRRSALLELLFLAKHYRSLSRPEIDNLVEVLQDKVDQLADVLSLRLPEGRDDRDVLLEAYEQMSDVAMESASDLFHRGRLEPPPLDADQTLLAEVRALAGAASLAVRRAQGESQSLGLKTQSAPAGTDEPAPPQQSTLAVPGTELPPDCQEARSASAATSTASSTPPLDARLAMFVATCRQERWSLSLLMVGIDRLEGVKRTGGPGVVRKILRLVELACGTLDHALLDCFQAGEGQVAVVLPACDRAQAVQYGNTLVRTLPQLFAATSDGGPAISLSVGAATVVVPPKNFPPGELLERASRCLYGARSGGGGGVKSIEII